MRDLIDGLNTRFEITLKSATEHEFYQNVYHYIDQIYKTPILKSILDQSEKEYGSGFSEIWKERKQYSEVELDVKSSEVYKLEHFNLYAVGCGMIMRVYYPIHIYRTSKEFDAEQDPAAVILIKGIRYAQRLKKWSEKYLKSINHWFEGKRGEYEVELRRFQLMFLEELVKIKEPVKNKTKTEFYLDIQSGNFRYHKIDGTLSPKSREFHFLKTLYSAPDHQATYKELCGNSETVTKNDKIMLTETIKIVKRKLGILPKKKGSNYDFIKNISKYGYKLDI